MKGADYFEKISAGAISPGMPECKAILVNLGNQEYITQALGELYSAGSYKVYQVNTTLAKLPKVLERCKEAGRTALVNCGENLPCLEGILPTEAYHAALISAGSYEDKTENILKQLLTDPHLVNFSHIGFQGYRYNPHTMQRLKARYFEEMRLGAIRDNIALCEPLVRDARYVFLDMKSIRYSDYPYGIQANPNGLYAEEACQIARYIGLGQNISAIFIFGSVGSTGKEKPLPVCSKLVAEIIWHICEAIASNLIEDPASRFSQEYYLKKIVNLGDNGQSITFINSTNTHRWWMEIPCGQSKNLKFIPCSESDYQTACTGEVPLRWLFFYTKYALL